MSENEDYEEMQHSFAQQNHFSPNSDEMDAMNAMDDDAPPAPMVRPRVVC